MATIHRDQLAPVVIRCNGRAKLSAGITPNYGANLVSLKVDGTELILWDPQALMAGMSHTGGFNMFPTPCRLDNSAYTFQNRRIQQRKNGQEVAIHGLVRDEVFTYIAEPGRIRSWIDITPEHPIYEGFPFKCCFAMTHQLDEEGLTVGFQLKNNDTRAIPFGYGIHPFWRIIGRRKDFLVRVPCANLLELKNLVPTGGYVPVGGLDLRTLRSLEGFTCDNCFWPRKPRATAEIIMAKPGVKIEISASANFPHMIVYAPAGERFACVENLTSSPNAPNLLSASHVKVASMLVAKPGQTVKGWVKYAISRIQ